MVDFLKVFVAIEVLFKESLTIRACSFCYLASLLSVNFKLNTNTNMMMYWLRGKVEA